MKAAGSPHKDWYAERLDFESQHRAVGQADSHDLDISGALIVSPRLAETIALASTVVQTITGSRVL